MALDIPTIRAALAEQIKSNISTEVNIYAGYRPTNPMLPAVIVLPADDGPYVDYEGSLKRPIATVRFSVQVLTRPGTGQGADGQRLLDAFISSAPGGGAPDSILDAIRSDRLLGGAVVEAPVVGPWDYRGLIQVGADANAQAEWASLVVELRQVA
jgi:hypothetical protein